MSEQKAQLLSDTGPFKNVTFYGYSSVEDFDRDAGRVGACLEEANYQLLYRGGFGEIHDKFIDQLESMSGMKRNVNEKATAALQARAKEGVTVTPVLENFVPFANRVRASLSDEQWAPINEAFLAVVKDTPLSSAPSTRSGGGGSVSKANQAKADAVLLLSPDEIESKVEKILAAVPSFNLVRDDSGLPDRVSLARGIAAWAASQEL